LPPVFSYHDQNRWQDHRRYISHFRARA
jgi:hypothetical protein